MKVQELDGWNFQLEMQKDRNQKSKRANGKTADDTGCIEKMQMLNDNAIEDADAVRMHKIKHVTGVSSENDPERVGIPAGF